jgi:glycosyltransferase involved in cell wall biosynthesis
LASGLPVVAANKDALPEIVVNPENGFLFEPGDQKALSEDITTILTDDTLKNRMGAYSLKLVQGHSIDNTIMKFENLYIEAIDKYKSK